MAERHHPRVTDKDVGGHGQQAPDQDLRQEAAPELRQHQRRHDQQRQDDREPGLVDGRRALAHFGVGTKRPVGRNSRVRMRTTKETITACAGLTQIEAYASSRLMKIEAAMEPPRLPMPPTTTTMKAFNIQSRPMVWLTPTSGPNSTPLAAAMPAPIANAPVWTHGTGMPMASAMTRSCVVARIQTPYLPYLRNSQKAPMMAAESAAISNRYQGYSR